MKTLSVFFVFFFSLYSVLTAQPQLPKFTVSKVDQSSSGYYFFSPIRLGASGPIGGFSDIILDAKGNLVYCKNYEAGFIAGNLTLHPNGKYSYFFENKYYVLDSLFQPADTVFCQNGIIQDTHEFLILPNGNYALLGYESSTMDLSKFFVFKKNGTQGLENTKVRCGVIQELNRKKEVVFEWHSKEHYQFDDIDTFYVSNLYDIDWTHFNSLEYDRDGNYLVSVKHFNEITKVNRSTGKIMWRLGGKRNQFAFLNDSLKFLGQHHIRRLLNTHITLFDNGFNRGAFHPETAKEYRIDEKKLTITLIWSHINNPKVWSTGYGAVQHLSSGNNLVSYGRNNKANVIFNVLNNASRVIFEVTSQDSSWTYRSANYSKLPAPLPQPQVKMNIQNGVIQLEAPAGYSQYYWNTGERGRSISVKKNGNYSVCVPFGPNAYLYSRPFLLDDYVRTNFKIK